MRIGLLRRGGIGDWIVFHFALESLRSWLGNDQVEIVVFAENRQAEIIEMIGLADRTICFDSRQLRRNLFARRALLADVRHEAFDAWIDADLNRSSLGDALARASAAPLRIAFSASAEQPCSRNFERRTFTHLIPDPLGSVHITDRFMRLMRFAAETLGARTGDTIVERPSGLRRYRWSGAGSSTLVIAPSASSPVRMWPVTRFAELAQHFSQIHALQLVLVGSSADAQAVHALHALVGRSTVRVGLDSLKELFELISSARMLLTNDSGPMHIGYVTATPTLALVSGADYTAYADYPRPHAAYAAAHATDTTCFNCRWRCTRHHGTTDTIKPCLNDVTVDQATHLGDALLIATRQEGSQ